MLSAPFQCDHCWFVNIQKREPVARNATDNMVLLLIRQVNLDIFWSRESSMVKNTLSNVLASARIRSSLRMPMENIVKGPWPVEDVYGFATAITILRKSLDPGKNVASYQQYGDAICCRWIFQKIIKKLSIDLSTRLSNVTFVCHSMILRPGTVYPAALPLKSSWMARERFSVQPKIPLILGCLRSSCWDAKSAWGDM